MVLHISITVGGVVLLLASAIITFCLGKKEVD